MISRPRAAAMNQSKQRLDKQPRSGKRWNAELPVAGRGMAKPRVEWLSPDWAAPSGILAAASIRGALGDDDGIADCNRGRAVGGGGNPFAGLNLALHVGDEANRVRRNRGSLAARFAPEFEFQWLRQVHGGDCATVTETQSELTADSLVTRTPGIMCCVLTADCLPVFVCARDGGEVAIIHAGWRGLRAGIIENTLAVMRTKPADLLVWLGPAILACHYEVGGELRDTFLGGAGDSGEGELLRSAFRPAVDPGKFCADLPRIAEIKLRALGVVAISGGTLCTYCNAEKFFSWRRDGQTGRMANMIGIKP